MQRIILILFNYSKCNNRKLYSMFITIIYITIESREQFTVE